MSISIEKVNINIPEYNGKINSEDISNVFEVNMGNNNTTVVGSVKLDKDKYTSPLEMYAYALACFKVMSGKVKNEDVEIDKTLIKSESNVTFKSNESSNKSFTLINPNYNNFPNKLYRDEFKYKNKVIPTNLTNGISLVPGTTLTLENGVQLYINDKYVEVKDKEKYGEEELKELVDFCSKLTAFIKEANGQLDIPNFARPNNIENNKIINMLLKLGIDINKPFYINEAKYEIDKNGYINKCDKNNINDVYYLWK